jgi:hypothetical protein
LSQLQPKVRPNLILHIGTYKTGSTAIQAFLRQKDARLREQGFLYPTIPNNKQSHTFLKREITNTLESNCKQESSTCINTITQQIEQYSPRSVILSSEHFWPTSPQLTRIMISSIEHLFSRIEVIIYLRHQRDLWMSLYSQFAKGLSVTPSHATWGTSEYCGKDIANHGMYYANVLDGYRNASDKISINARIYDRSLFPERDVVSDFAATCKLSMQDLGDASRAGSNESLGWKGVEFSKALATYYHHDLQRRKAISRAMRIAFNHSRKLGFSEWVGKSPNKLTEDDQEKIYHHYSDNNSLLSRDYFDSANVFPAWKHLPVDSRSLADIPPEEKSELAAFMLARTDDESLQDAFRHMAINT